MHYDILAFPFCRDAECFSVAAYVIVRYRNLRRIVLELVSPGISCVHIDRVTESVEFPHPRNRHLVPAIVVIIRFPETGRTLV